MRIKRHALEANASNASTNYMIKLRRICDVLEKWGALQTFKDELDNLNGPITSPIEIHLGLGAWSIDEFEI